MRPFREICEVVVLDGQRPPDDVVEGEGDEDADEPPVLDHQLPVPWRVRRKVLQLIFVRFAQFLTWMSSGKIESNKMWRLECEKRLGEGGRW